MDSVTRRISATLKDAEANREAEIDKLASRLAETFTPLIADHIEQNGRSKPMRLQQEFGSWNIVKSDDDYEPQPEPKLSRLSFFQARQARLSANGKAGYLLLNTKDRTFRYRRKKDNNEHIQSTIPVDEILQRLISLYRKASYILDIDIADSKARHEPQCHHFAFNIRLQPIQVSDKPKPKVSSKSNGVAKATPTLASTLAASKSYLYSKAIPSSQFISS